MKKTPLYQIHVNAGAKMVPFAGYLMPVHYSGIREEHLNVRKNVGVFDVSHMGEFIIKGKQALAWVQHISSNDASKLAIGQAQYSYLPNRRGGITDDMIVYRLPEDQCGKGEQAFLMVVNASNLKKDWKHINSFRKQYDARLIDISDDTGLIAVQGPNAAKALQPLTDIPLNDIEYYHFRKGTIAGVENVLISATGYTGSGGFELYAPEKDSVQLWEAIFKAGKSLGIQPAGLGARDTLRLEMGYALYGNDIDQYTSPYAAGLGWITKLKKGAFVGSDRLQKQKATGTATKLVGFEVDGRRVPRHNYRIMNEAGQPIGKVTSGTSSPSLEIPIGMGYVKKKYSKAGQQIWIELGSKLTEATVVKPPFVKI